MTMASLRTARRNIAAEDAHGIGQRPRSIYNTISIYIYVWLGAMDGLERGAKKGRRVAFHLFTLFH